MIFNLAYLLRRDFILWLLRNPSDIFQPSLWLDKDMSYQPITGSRLQCCHQVVMLCIKVVFFFSNTGMIASSALRDFLRLRDGYIYKYVLPRIVENLERTVIKWHATQRNRGHTMWLSLADSHSCAVPGSSSITPVIQHWDHASCPKLSDMDVASCGEGGATLGYCSITTSYAVRMKQELCRCSALAELGLSPTTSVKSVHQCSFPSSAILSVL